MLLLLAWLRENARGKTIQAVWNVMVKQCI